MVIYECTDCGVLLRSDDVRVEYYTLPAKSGLEAARRLPIRYTCPRCGGEVTEVE